MGAQDSSAPRVGAGARALQSLEHLRRVNDLREVDTILRRAVFEFATPDRRTLPPNVVAELVRSPHARPELALYAVQQISDRCKAARAAGKPANPIGMLIAAFGAQRHGRGRPWEVPELFMRGEWARRQAARCEAAALQEHVNALREQRTAGEGPAARSV